MFYLEKRRLYISQAQGVENETDDIYGDNRNQLFGNDQVKLW